MAEKSKIKRRATNTARMGYCNGHHTKIFCTRFERVRGRQYCAFCAADVRHELAKEKEFLKELRNNQNA